MIDLKATPEDVRYAYRLLLGREPDEEGYRHYCKWLESEGADLGLLALMIMDSDEFRSRHRPPDGPESASRLHSQACTQAQIESPAFRYWAVRMHQSPGALHRKLWEFCYIVQALHERGMLQAGRRGLGFAVGTEPLGALFASRGCSIVASDIGSEDTSAGDWISTNQHAVSTAQLNQSGICDPDQFAARVRFRVVDMRAIPDDLRGFDFLWSSCALEHLGNLQLGMDFVWNAMACLRPGGVAVHTTEFNCDSNDGTIDTGSGVVYRRRDLEDLAARLHSAGHEMEPLDFHLGDTEADRHVDEPPHRGMPHLKLRLGPYASTSFGFIIRKGAGAAAA